jgi:hypothetical protein
MTFAERLQNAYFHANRASIEHGHGKVSKGLFMKQSFAEYEVYESKDEKGRKSQKSRQVDRGYGKYSNEDSARRAYDKLTSQRKGKGYETSGKRYQQRASAFYGMAHKEGPRGGLQGLWRVDITYTFTNEEGKDEVASRSFIMESREYTNIEDLPYLYAIVPELVDEHMEYWQETGSVWEDYEVTEVEITPIRHSTIHKEMEQKRGTYGTPGQGRVEIDDLEIE